MIIRFLKENSLFELQDNIANNLEFYRSGSFDFLETDPTVYFNSKAKIEVDLDILSKIQVEENDLKEPENCKLMYEALPLRPYLARDRRLWVYMTHTYMLEYVRKRWIIPDDDEEAVKHIKTHFFVAGNRGLERDNAASRLWWMAHLCDRVKGLSLDESLKCFLFRSDVRANIIERPTTSQSISVFTAIIKKLNESLKHDQSLFHRDNFRPFMKSLNLKGGVKLLDLLDDDAMDEIVEECCS